MLALVQVLSKVAATTECHCHSILIEPHRNTGRGITIGLLRFPALRQTG